MWNRHSGISSRPSRSILNMNRHTIEMGKLELRNNHLQKAVENLAHAIQINPASQRSYYLLIQAYARLGEQEKAQLVKQQWNTYKQAHPLLPAGTPPESPALEVATEPGSSPSSTPP